MKNTILQWEKPVIFDENFKWESSLTFTSESFMDWVYATMPGTRGMEIGWDNRVELGEYAFYMREMGLWHMESLFMFCAPRETRSRLSIYRGTTVGEIGFDAPVLIPVLADSKQRPWMSLTPNEILTLRGSIRRSKGLVGIAGLGLGWVVRKVLERNKVSHVTVVERDKDLISYFGKELLDEYGDRLTIVEGDAYQHDWFEYDVSLWDIWKSYGDAAWDSRYHKIRDKLRDDGKVCIGWGEGITR